MIDTARLAQEIQALIAHPTSNLTAASLLLAIVVIGALVILIIALLLLTSGTARSKRQHPSLPGAEASRPDGTRETPGTLGRRVTTLAIVLIAALSVAATYVYTGRSEYCASSCHTMTPAADSWESSSHATVACVSCHESSIAGGISSRVRHLVAEAARSTTGEMKAAVESDRCVSCHTKSRGTTMIKGAETSVAHGHLTALDRPCTECHERVGHTKSLASGAL